MKHKLERVARHVDDLRFAQAARYRYPHVRRRGRRAGLFRREDYDPVRQLGRRVRVSKAEVVHRVQRQQMVQELFHLVVAAHERGPLVQLAQQRGIGQQGAKVARQHLLLERQPYPGTSVADVRFNVRHCENVAGEEESKSKWELVFIFFWKKLPFCKHTYRMSNSSDSGSGRSCSGPSTSVSLILQ